jgi:hypothetical protein
MIKRFLERLKDFSDADESLPQTGGRNRERCLKLSQVFSSNTLTKAEIEGLIRTSSTYEHFRVALVFMSAARSELAALVVARWREGVRDLGRTANGRTRLPESPSFRQFSLKAKPPKPTDQKNGDDDTSALAATVQRKLLSVLGCPITRGPVEVIPTVLAADAVREGVIVSRRLERVIGAIKNFQVDFVRFPECRDLAWISTAH